MKTLQLTFTDADNRPFNITLDEPRTNLTKEEIERVMDQIIQDQVFMPRGFALVAKKTARIIDRRVEEIYP